MEFTPFDKTPRLNRECAVTEKIDGTNAQISIGEVFKVTCEKDEKPKGSRE
jgi:hypothetical protein